MLPSLKLDESSKRQDIRMPAAAMAAPAGPPGRRR